jgi:penicillin-binding protein 2
LIFTIFGFFLLRLFDIQILQGAAFVAQADDNRTRVIRDPAIRGTIYDRNGYVLAQNVPPIMWWSFQVICPADEGDTQAIFRELSVLIDMPVSLGDTDEETVRNLHPVSAHWVSKKLFLLLQRIGRFKRPH